VHALGVVHPLLGLGKFDSAPSDVPLLPTHQEINKARKNNVCNYNAHHVDHRLHSYLLIGRRSVTNYHLTHKSIR
jgi:hypothetical protein